MALHWPTWRVPGADWSAVRMTTTRYSLWRLLRRLFHLSPTQPDQPPESDDREESGATEDWSPMEDVARAESIPDSRPAPDFDTHVWTVDVHGELNALEDAFRHDVEHFWNWAYDQLGIDARTRLRLPSAVEQTGEFDRRELDALLAGVA